MNKVRFIQQGRITSAFDEATTALEAVQGIDLSGKRAIVTGGAAGIGKEICRALATVGGDVLIADRDTSANAETIAEFAADGLTVSADALDLGSFESIRTFAERVRNRGGRLDILINNAGVMAPPLLRTKEGHELQFGVNFLGHYLLVTELLPGLLAARGRLVSVSSIGHRRADIDYDDPDFLRHDYDRWVAYGQSKTANALLAVGMDARHGSQGLTANAMNPGGSMTGLQRFLSDDELKAMGWIDEQGNVLARWRSPEQCAATSVWLATAPELEGQGGRYFENCAEAAPWRPEEPMKGVRPYAVDPANAERLFAMADRMIAAT